MKGKDEETHLFNQHPRARHARARISQRRSRC